MKKVRVRVKVPDCNTTEGIKEICANAEKVNFLVGHRCQKGFFDVTLVTYKNKKYVVSRLNGEVNWCVEL